MRSRGGGCGNREPARDDFRLRGIDGDDSGVKRRRGGEAHGPELGGPG